MSRKRKKPIPPGKDIEQELSDAQMDKLAEEAAEIAGLRVEVKSHHHAISPIRFHLIATGKLPLPQITDEELTAFLCFRMAQAKPYPSPRT